MYCFVSLLFLHISNIEIGMYLTMNNLFQLFGFVSFLKVCRNDNASYHHGTLEGVKYSKAMLSHIASQIPHVSKGSVFEASLLLK